MDIIIEIDLPFGALMSVHYVDCCHQKWSVELQNMLYVCEICLEKSRENIQFN